MGSSQSVAQYDVPAHRGSMVLLALPLAADIFPEIGVFAFDTAMRDVILAAVVPAAIRKGYI